MYIFYVDESGNLDIKNQKSWVYALTAVGIFEHNWPKFYKPLVLYKRKLIEKICQRTNVKLGIHACEIKSTWIRIPKRRKESVFLSSLEDCEITDLVNLYYEQLDLIKSVCISVVVDKRKLLPEYNQTSLHIKAWELLCERIENFMREHHPKHRAIIVADDVSPQENAALANSHAEFLEKRTSAGLPIRRIIEMSLFVRSEFSEGVQLADLCAYNVYHSATYNKPEYPFFQKLFPHYYNSHNTAGEKIDGLKIFPNSSDELSTWWTGVCKKASA